MKRITNNKYSYLNSTYALLICIKGSLDPIVI